MLLHLTETEHALVLKALHSLADTNSWEEALRLKNKISEESQPPNITVGVYGGQVQWVLGNPFPIRICDYDGDDDDLPNTDERGQRCRMWFEPPEAQLFGGTR